VLGDVPECFLGNAVHGQTSRLGERQWSRGEHGRDLEAVHALHFGGQLAEGDHQASTVEHGRVKPVGHAAECGAEVIDLFADGVEARLRGSGLRAGDLVDLAADEHDLLQHVVVDFACDPGALFLLGGEQAARMLPVNGHDPSLGGDHGYPESGGEDHDGEADRDEDPPDCGSVVGHSRPHETVIIAAIALAARTCAAV
jgi:hypothetical protein